MKDIAKEVFNSNKFDRPIDENGYPIPRSEICSECGEKF